MKEYTVITKNHTVKGKAYGEKVELEAHEAEYYLKNGYVIGDGDEGNTGSQEVVDTQTHAALSELKSVQEQTLTKLDKLDTLDDLLTRLDEPITTRPEGGGE